MIEDLLLISGVIFLAFIIGYAKGSEFTEDRIRTKFCIKKDYSYNDFMDVIDDN
jgi:hypothetical protein